MILRFLRGFGNFWYQLIIGDDWRMAAGVTIALVAGGFITARTTMNHALLTVLIGVLIALTFIVVVTLGRDKA